MQGQITQIKNIYTRTGKVLQQASMSDGTDTIELAWFNQPYLVKSLPPGTLVSISGKVSIFAKKRSLVSPQYEKLEAGNWKTEHTIHTGRLVPVYPETAGLSSKWLRAKIAKILPEAIAQVQEYLPETIRRKNGLPEIKEALAQIHFPESNEKAEIARKRFAFDEFFKLQLIALTRKKAWKETKKAFPLNTQPDKVRKFIRSLPFTLTEGQKQAVQDILSDLTKPQSMNRLLEGDVGSGKTVVASLAAYVAWLNGRQTLFMAPTQILAIQHFNTLKNILEPHGVSIELITAGKKLKLNSSNSKTGVIVGTHALLHKTDFFENVAFVVIDEQHRFGVAQRAFLAQERAGCVPHVLTMTATPIPRTVALTFYGDLDLSVIRELPHGRLKVKTWVVPPQKRQGAYTWIRQRVKDTDEQAFIICPLIDTSEVETLKNVKAANAEFERLASNIFPDLRIGLLHGRMKTKEKDEVMAKFKAGKLDILVSTPVVEVGIDVPKATIILIEAAERFGLAQLHQLRGRVGRGEKQSYCLLFPEILSPKVISRLKALERGISGGELAELDLKLRGPGEIYGTTQTGFPELKVGSYSDTALIKAAREAASEVLEDLQKHPRVQDLIKNTNSIAPN